MIRVREFRIIDGVSSMLSTSFILGYRDLYVARFKYQSLRGFKAYIDMKTTRGRMTRPFLRIF